MLSQNSSTPANDVASPEVPTVPELAELLRMRPKSVYDLISRGEIPGMALGRLSLRGPIAEAPAMFNFITDSPAFPIVLGAYRCAIASARGLNEGRPDLPQKGATIDRMRALAARAAASSTPLEKRAAFADEMREMRSDDELVTSARAGALAVQKSGAS